LTLKNKNAVINRAENTSIGAATRARLRESAKDFKAADGVARTEAVEVNP
jgi:hypothetical protein